MLSGNIITICRFVSYLQMSWAPGTLHHAGMILHSHADLTIQLTSHRLHTLDPQM